MLLFIIQIITVACKHLAPLTFGCFLFRLVIIDQHSIRIGFICQVFVHSQWIWLWFLCSPCVQTNSWEWRHQKLNKYSKILKPLCSWKLYDFIQSLNTNVFVYFSSKYCISSAHFINIYRTILLSLFVCYSEAMKMRPCLHDSRAKQS